jgi:hypothetical protein
LSQRHKEKTTARQLAGNNLHFWSQFFQRGDSEKLDDLMECFLVDLRGKIKMIVPCKNWDKETKSCTVKKTKILCFTFNHHCDLFTFMNCCEKDETFFREKK